MMKPVEYKDNEKVLFKTKAKISLPGKKPEEVDCLVTEGYVMIEAEEPIKIPLSRIKGCDIQYQTPSISYSSTQPQAPASVTTELTFLDDLNKKRKLLFEMATGVASNYFKETIDNLVAQQKERMVGGMRVPVKIYELTFDLRNLSDEQRRQFSQHRFTSTFPTALVIFLYFITGGIFSLIYFGLKHSKLPRIKHDDFGAGKAIGFMLIPFFNVYWAFNFWLRLVERVNFQFRLAGHQPAISENLMAITILLTWITVLFNFIPFLNVVTPFTGIAAVIMLVICMVQIQIATNKLAKEVTEPWQK